MKKLLAALCALVLCASSVFASDIPTVLADKSFYQTTCVAQAAGNLTSVTLWNPPGSGVAFSLVKSGVWSTVNTQFNLKRTATITGFGADLNVRNSKYFPGNGVSPASSQTRTYRLTSGTTPVANSVEVYDANMPPMEDEYPFTMGPGEGLVIIPDTTANTNWCWSATFIETPIPE